MRRRLLLAVAVTIAVSGCGRHQATATPPKPKSLAQADPAAYHQSVQAATKEVPPQFQSEFQKLFVCEVKRNNKSGSPKPITADYMRELAAYLKAHPNAGDSCDA